MREHVAGGGSASRVARRFTAVTMVLGATILLGLFAMAQQTDSDSDGMSDTYEALFGLDPDDPADAGYDNDSDTLCNLAEYGQTTDPFEADTDGDGFSDAYDSTPVSRAYLDWGNPKFSQGDDHTYTGPAWWFESHRMNGEWSTNEPTAWHVAMGASNDIGRLCVSVDRTILTNDAVLELTYFDHTNASLYVDLYGTNGELVVTNMCGNISEGGNMLTNTLIGVPFASLPAAWGIQLRRGYGEVSVYCGVLYVDEDGDGLDREQEAQVGTSDSAEDTDADGLADGFEVLESNTAPTTQDTDADGASDYWEIVNGTDPLTASSVAPLDAGTCGGGSDHSVYVLSDGRVAVCGKNPEGRLGLNTQTTYEDTLRLVVNTAATVPLSNVLGVAAGHGHVLALQSDGAVLAWGRSDYGATGQGNTTHLKKPAPVKDAAGTGTLTGIASIGAGPYHSFALGQDGKVWGWGLNDKSQLGDGSTTSRTLPVRVHGIGGSGHLTGVTHISGGGRHSAAITYDSRVLTWGDNSKGELGNGTYNNRTYPDYVVGAGGSGLLSNITQVAACERFTIALASDGTVWSWGQNWARQLGDGTTTDRTTPVHVVGTNGTGQLSGIVAIAAGESHTLALGSDGTLYAWGMNDYGQLGDPDYASGTSVPIPVKTPAGDVPFTLAGGQIGCGWKHSIAMAGGHTAYAWGNNAYASLGDGSITDRNLPVLVDGDADTLPDVWEYVMLADLDDDADGDPDDDGATNGEEYQAGTDPTVTDAAPAPVITVAWPLNFSERVLVP